MKYAMPLRLTVKILLALSALPLMATAAKADFRICNTTQEVVGVVIGYRAPSGWVSEGWWTINPTSCRSVIEGPLSSRFYYLHAEASKGEGRWEGPVNMCIMESKFRVDGVHDCFARGYQKTGFQEVDTGSQTSWMVQLSGASNNSSLASSPLVTGTGQQ